MKVAKEIFFGTLLALPFIGVLVFIAQIPECPTNFTSQQLESTHCLTGAHLSLTLFIILTVAVWLAAIGLVHKLMKPRAIKNKFR